MGQVWSWFYVKKPHSKHTNAYYYIFMHLIKAQRNIYEKKAEGYNVIHILQMETNPLH